MTTTKWPYPGSRWWKFDFHTHTPASHDTPWHRGGLVLSAEDWLLRYMAAEIDCVAVTDHNSGAWVDTLKIAYAQMKAQPPAGFRELTLFPGVEISVQGGVHVLAIFDPAVTTSDIDTLLGAVGYQGTKGDSDAVTSRGIAEVIQAILTAGAVPIPAHADKDKGLLQCKPNTKQSEVDANTLRQAMGVEGLLAVEWGNGNTPWPQCVATDEPRLAKVLGSDCHSFQSAQAPGSAYTWVKMASPTLEGLRLALLDGNGVSIRRSDEGAFDPFKLPAHIITGVEIENARYMGNGQVARLDCSPFFNAVVGGRGTGKSTVVHGLRLAAGRVQELTALGQDSEPRAHFDEFRKVATGRDGKGALRAETVIRLEWQHDDDRLRLSWSANGQGAEVQEWRNGQWQQSPSQSVNAARFPLRIFSQGQIAALAGSGRQTLLAIIDEAGNVEPLKQVLEEARRTFFTQRARLRELDGKLAGQAEVERRLDEAGKKLAALSQADHATVLRAYAQAQHQEREVSNLFEQLRDGAQRIAALPEQIVLDDWPGQHFTEQDADLLAWRKDADAQVEQVRAGLQEQARKLDALIETLQKDARHAQWKARAQAARQAHAALQQQFAAQGVSDPQAFARLTQEKQQLETQHKALQKMKSDRQELAKQIEAQQKLLAEKRQSITQARQSFIRSALTNNTQVRIAVAPFGFGPRQIERELRELIDVTDNRFEDDILKVENGEPSGGMAFTLARADDAGKVAAVTAAKQQLLGVLGGGAPDDLALGGHFRNYLQRKREKPEFADHVLAWFPEDDLRIEYRRDEAWHPISRGSQGQRSAALLAFLLAFGEEPIVLDQPEDDLDNHLIYDLIVRQIRENKLRRQLIVVTHNPNVVVNGDAELVHLMGFGRGQCFVQQSGALQESKVRREVCRVMEGGHEAFSRRWKRLGTEV
ncbi:TrlF family AAA-like ATPase [Verminephrobacter eiseniae]|uniref:PHP N-terminal domain protein n=1 Tax=Verminephrobacter eiseniae (strain EF01-2) TaxID=391735 RepID=A1WL65_VEREI|nr:AAA family ATPase [Verminephrobacter eiseniae]ABM58372.1 PHP N-terminal domain protein [Verminephrobacter eiseniae EF01-2]MCW5283950.1 chromosome segregation protein SMC [Verminephrobacter eiseniae]MCW5301659.1 chromosome segregation protein SMC [Verminephrobacter eiseniae]MCW8180323.1 chromosome segregation protein SMC [Verminephrobacter eiseniae]MCW8192542.1 chromosome segregation protein SMC [Verminephrobacter eiseniae]